MKTRTEIANDFLGGKNVKCTCGSQDPRWHTESCDLQDAWEEAWDMAGDVMDQQYEEALTEDLSDIYPDFNERG